MTPELVAKCAAVLAYDEHQLDIQYLDEDGKHAIVKAYGQKCEYDTFIETGTFRGDMVAAVKDVFANVVSIELVPALHKIAAARFVTDKHVRLFLGDSPSVLKDILLGDRLSIINAHKVLFWLDAHSRYDET